MKRLWIFVCLLLIALAAVACDKLPDTPTSPGLGSPPVILSFSADATRLGPPNGNTLDTFLRWSVSGSSDTRCRIDPKVGDVPLGGFVSVRPGVSTEYVLACTNRDGSVNRSVSIIVN